MALIGCLVAATQPPLGKTIEIEQSEVGRVGAVQASVSFKELGVCPSGYEHNQVLSFV